MPKIKIFSDGGSRGNPGPSACAYVVYKNGEIIKKEAFYLGDGTNNFAEYTGVVKVFEWLVESGLEIDGIEYYLDSELVVNQLSGKFKVKSETIKPLVEKVNDLKKHLGVEIKFVHVRREFNKEADRLLNEKLNENLQRFHVPEPKI